MSMHISCDCKEYELICTIVNYGLASKVIKTAKQNGVLGATVFFGRGTVNNSILKFLDLTDSSKEIVWMITGKELADKTMEELDKKFAFHKPNHGIAFRMPIANILGASNCPCDTMKEKRGDNPMYNAIFVIVDKGNAETAIEAATKAGARGGTIINARGSGIHETSKVFSMDIQPEKEVVLILSEVSATDNIANAIKETMKMDEPGNGIIFIQDVSKTYGIYQ